MLHKTVKILNLQCTIYCNIQNVFIVAENFADRLQYQQYMESFGLFFTSYSRLFKAHKHDFSGNHMMYLQGVCAWFLEVKMGGLAVVDLQNSQNAYLTVKYPGSLDAEVDT